MVLKVNRKTEPNLFNEISEMIIEDDSRHRRSSNFFTVSIVEFKPEHAQYYTDLIRPFEEYIGTWETNTYITDSEYGTNWNEITELIRVEKKEETIIVTKWVKLIGGEEKVKPVEPKIRKVLGDL